MSQKYPGGIISKTPPVTVGPVDGEGGSAPGVWTLEQALELQKQNLWPKPVIPKELWSWGRNSDGELGLNDTNSRNSPVQVGSANDWKSAARGGGGGLYRSHAIKSTGTLWSWGKNTNGQLGLTDTIDRSSPVQIGALSVWRTVAAGSYASFAIRTSGTLWSWGRGGGTLGNNTSGIAQSSPIQVGSLTNWEAISSGTDHAVAIKTDGTLWAWGSGNYGRLGLNNTTSSSSPTQVGALTNWKQVSCFATSTAAVKTDGTLWAWGRNGNGETGQPGQANSSSPVQIGALTNWDKIAAGYDHCLAVKTDGTLWAWGRNSYGQLGQNSATQFIASPVQIGALTTWGQISAGRSFGHALKTDGTLWGWGKAQDFGQVGNSNTTNRSSPVQIGSLTTWKNLSLSGQSGHGIAFKTP
jgi:alpha-tubulin suppressor-like RCC1 family protein